MFAEGHAPLGVPAGFLRGSGLRPALITRHGCVSSQRSEPGRSLARTRGRRRPHHRRAMRRPKARS
ncbi:hypothetical protein FM106_25035 [Brachybacterium faecium]|nr:hypothetical protein FM106_25035 [Brachybacterium faecium]